MTRKKQELVNAKTGPLIWGFTGSNTPLTNRRENNMSRIKTGDNALDTLIKMSDDNPEAIAALMNIMVKSAKIYSQKEIGMLSVILFLDAHEIYGTDICILYNDKCQRDFKKLMVLLAACDLDIMPKSKLQSLAGDRTGEIELEDIEFSVLDAKVCEQLADFQRPPAANDSEQPDKIQ